MKKAGKKVKKPLDKGLFRCYISRAPVRGGHESGRRPEKSLKKEKVFS
jgi:hypothetical protein